MFPRSFIRLLRSKVSRFLRPYKWLFPRDTQNSILPWTLWAEAQHAISLSSCPLSVTPYSSVFIDNTDILVNWTWVFFSSFRCGLHTALSSASFSLCGYVSWMCQGLTVLASLWVLTLPMVCSGKEATEWPLWLQLHFLKASPLPGSICTHAEVIRPNRQAGGEASAPGATRAIWVMGGFQSSQPLWCPV